MPMTYKTPNVYVEEQSLLPPSVASVSSAVPAFIGLTEFGDANIPKRITSILEYEQYFGKGEESSFTANVTGGEFAGLAAAPDLTCLMYPSLRLYFDNGGGPCYVVSIGTHGDALTPALFTAALDALRLEDEPTLVLPVDAVLMAGDSEYAGVCDQVLLQCDQLKDRFGIFDVQKGDDGTAFRDDTGMTALAYGAVYYPWLRTNLGYNYSDASVSISGMEPIGNLGELLPENTGLYNEITAALDALRVKMPPSAAVAGVYCRVDASRGVWKAPANESLTSVIEPTVRISDNVQDGLNVDATSGKSINAIRAFPGRGNLVWGARTLDGNANDWRYISVRRLFIYVEESIKKSTSWAVFEPNSAVTWLKIKTMIESFLGGLWQQGGLQGNSADEAFFVNVGLGTTMTEQDLLEGNLIVEAGLAAVRPAEFIILRFSHKLQQS